jgi:acetylornithine deacetylase/succinyl-diaminopimelate desuccinylase-like protein
MARANVNCRIFPGEDPAEIRKTLERVVADTKVTVADVPLHAADGSLVRLVTVPPSPLLPEVTQAMDKTVHQLYGNIPVMATMSTGATDGRITRSAGIPTYGISCMFFQMNDNRAHGKDERVGVSDFYDGITFNYNLIRALSSSN